MILADNPYRELRFAGQQESVEEFNNSDHVLHINTFTKTLGPGLRLGWTVAPERLSRDLVALRSRQDSHSSTLVQAIIGELVTSDPGIFDATLDKARACTRTGPKRLSARCIVRRQGAFDTVLPDGGLFLWPKLADSSVNPDQLAADASAEGVEYQRGGSFFPPSGPGTDADRHLRLAYGDVPAAKLEEAAARLGGGRCKGSRAR